MWLVRLALSAIPLAVMPACEKVPQPSNSTQPTPARERESVDEREEVLVPSDELQHERERMVREQIEARGVVDPRVLAAMRRVPRHRFVPEDVRHNSYADRPLPIGHAVTISQPYIVAIMTQHAAVDEGDKVLEVGTGSGYQAAVLAEMGASVYSIEIIEPLHQRAVADLDSAGYEGVHLRAGDGYAGWPEAAPFDAIILTAAPPEVPQPLLEQLADQGRLVAPVGPAGGVQDLLVVQRRGDDYEETLKEAVRFVPMTGRAQEKR